ncbi:MAG: hypothetical protein ACYC7D_08675 [Nitrososphaerales archaeon]
METETQGKDVLVGSESKRGKKSPDEERQERIMGILDDSLASLSDYSKRVDRLIELNDGNPRRVAILVNAKARAVHEMFVCISIMRDPKLRLTTTRGKNRDLARLLERTVRREKASVSRLEAELGK